MIEHDTSAMSAWVSVNASLARHTRVLRLDVDGEHTDVAEGFEVANEVPCTGAGFSKSRRGIEVRCDRLDCLRWRGVGVVWPPREDRTNPDADDFVGMARPRSIMYLPSYEYGDGRRDKEVSGGSSPSFGYAQDRYASGISLSCDAGR